MASVNTITIWSLCITACFVAPIAALTSTMTPPPSEMSLAATPGVFYEGLTKDLGITCSLAPQQDTEFQTVISLILSKSGDNGVYSEVAAVTAISGDNVMVNDALSSQVTGQLLGNGHGFIRYQWTYPGAEIKGGYRCEAHGMDLFGHPMVVSADVDINEGVLDNGAVQAIMLEKMRHLESKLDNETSALRTQVDALTTRLDESRSAIMEFSGTYRGHHYYLSYHVWRNAPFADSMCRLYGGYLAEADDRQEFDFLHNLIKTSKIQEKVMIGGVEDGVEDTWKFQRSGENMTYFYWANGQPNDGGHHDNCMIFWPSSDFKMADEPCFATDWQRYMCEVPY